MPHTDPGGTFSEASAQAAALVDRPEAARVGDSVHLLALRRGLELVAAGAVPDAAAEELDGLLSAALAALVESEARSRAPRPVATV